jgi:SM-20-related protein
MIALNPHLPVADLHQSFADAGRVQIRNVLTEACARQLAQMLMERTDWGLAWQAGSSGPVYERAATVRSTGEAEVLSIQQRSYSAMQSGDYAFQFGSYPMLRAYLERWSPNGDHDIVFEHINDRPFLDLVRTITGIEELKKADAQATLYAPGHFLAEHDDSHVGQGWRVAYVLNLCPVEWRADWGGYLNFLDEKGDVVLGWKPQFNTLNLFRVPQRHHVTMVAPFAPIARFAITGWFRDR